MTPMGPATKDTTHWNVVNLLLVHSYEWDNEKVINLFLELALKIICIKPSTMGSSEKHIWLATKFGEYSKKQVIMLHTNYKTNLRYAICDIWNRKIPPRMKIIMWKVVYRALALGSNL